MKGFISVLVLVTGVLGEAPAPYPPSGWRPDGPAFDLPARVQLVQNQKYLPPLEPRNTIPNRQYGAPNDVSVQGLPTLEQQPIFEISPINGQQNQGASFKSDIRNLDQNLQQVQYQQQQEIYRQFQRQKELETAKPSNKASNLPSPQNPRQFASRPATPKSTTPKLELTTTETPAKQVTEPNLNEREILEDEGSPAKLRATSVEITKQNIQQYPGELFLSSLAQLQLQPQFVPLQQVRASYVQSGEVTPKQVGFDGPTHLAALPSVLAQQQAGEISSQNPQLLIGEQLTTPGYAPQPQYQPTSYQPQPQYQQPIAFQPQAVDESYLPADPNGFAVQQPLPQYQPVQTYQPQIQAQPVILQPQQLNQQPSQAGQVQSKENDDNDEDKNKDDSENINGYKNQPQPQPDYQQPQQVYQQPQQVYQQPQQVYQQPQQVYQQPQQVYQQPEQVYQQPQQVYQQPQQVYQQPQQEYQQPQQLYQQPLLLPPQPFNQYQAPQLFPAQLVKQDQLYQGQYQPQLVQGTQQQFQPQDALQSGLDVNSEDNDIDQAEEKDAEEDDASRTTAVATAFGARTQPRVFTQYGAPFPDPRARRPAGPQYSTTTESTVEEVTGDTDIAEAVAVSSEIRKRNGRLRSRRIRPVIAVDRAGRLVLAAE